MPNVSPSLNFKSLVSDKCPLTARIHPLSEHMIVIGSRSTIASIGIMIADGGCPISVRRGPKLEFLPKSFLIFFISAAIIFHRRFSSFKRAYISNFSAVNSSNSFRIAISSNFLSDRSLMFKIASA